MTSVQTDPISLRRAQAHALEPMLRKFELRAPLDAEDRQAFLDLPCRLQRFDQSSYLLREGDRSDQSCMLLSGFACRHKLTGEGTRQIISVHIAGDFLNLEGALIEMADDSIQTLARCEVAVVPRAALRDLLLKRPRLAAAMWIDTLIDGAILREWMLNIGRRDARARIAHLICELARRLEIAGLSRGSGYDLPLTQEQLADATGLTSVHVNRVLRGFDIDGLVIRTRRHIGIPDWEALRAVAGFNENYLHFDRGGSGNSAVRFH